MNKYKLDSCTKFRCNYTLLHCNYNLFYPYFDVTPIRQGFFYVLLFYFAQIPFRPFVFLFMDKLYDFISF